MKKCKTTALNTANSLQQHSFLGIETHTNIHAYILICKKYKMFLARSFMSRAAKPSFGNLIKQQTICQDQQIRLFGSVLKKRKKKMNKHKLKKLRKKLKRKNNQ
jgi:hypothetical protein